ncbi:TIM44-like domain-containing protein [Bradyrhizobium sp. Tv2a-2]|uniref:Tim44 domain-containing protein n=1 Tax=Bradyrhizobium sp. Tv2a-2 TaxID=113395 RepID=UPI0004184862|nr:TIM44-like domain-containing protein [Bradyrhizobium sp. Tv2a-2]
MNFVKPMRKAMQAVAILLALAIPTLSVVTPADARIGGGFSSGSRGSRSFSTPPSTSTAPGTASPFSRSFTQPSSPSYGPGTSGGFFNRSGGGLLRGLAAGFIGAGLFGLLFGGGLFSGLGGFSSLLGLLLQIVLIVFLARWAMSWWQRRNMGQPAYAGAGPTTASNLRTGMGGFGFGTGTASTPLQIQPADYEAFERLLTETQAAWSDEDMARLSRVATPEMVAFFERDMADNRARNQINKVSGTKLLQGDLSEAWREGDTDYASVAMRFSMIDRMLDRATGRLVGGSEQPQEAVEVWTFVRPHGGEWILSAIQQSN